MTRIIEKAKRARKIAEEQGRPGGILNNSRLLDRGASHRLLLFLVVVVMELLLDAVNNACHG